MNNNNNEPRTMTQQEAIELLCEEIGKVFNNDFPCICGKNPFTSKLYPKDIARLHDILDAIKLCQE